MSFTVNHNTSIISGECVRCSKGIVRASEQLSIKFCVIPEAMNSCKNLKIH